MPEERIQTAHVAVVRELVLEVVVAHEESVLRGLTFQSRRAVDKLRVLHLRRGPQLGCRQADRRRVAGVMVIGRRLAAEDVFIGPEEEQLVLDDGARRCSLTGLLRVESGAGAVRARSMGSAN